jgi:hypothetical protein
MIQLLADLILPVGVALLWAAFHIFLGHGLYLPITYTQIKEGNFDENPTTNDSSPIPR